MRRTLTVERTVIELPGKAEDGGGLRVDTPKSQAGHRTVPDLDHELCDRLRDHCASLSPRDYVFGDRDANGKPRPLNHGNFYKRVIKPAFTELGIGMTFHGLRHHYASLLIDLGLNPVEVASRLGHSSAVLTLNTYAHLFKQEAASNTEAIAQRRAEARGETAKVTHLPRRRAVGKKPF